MAVGSPGREHAHDVGPRLGEWNVDDPQRPATRPGGGHPAVDVGFAAVVRGQGQRRVTAVHVEQIAQVVAAVGDVDLGRRQVRGGERRGARAMGEVFGSLGQDLHQALGAGRRRARIELGLGINDRRDQRRVEVLVGRLVTDHVLVA